MTIDKNISIVDLYFSITAASCRFGHDDLRRKLNYENLKSSSVEPYPIQSKVRKPIEITKTIYIKFTADK